LQEQAAGHAAEVRKLYDWRDVMKTVHNERLQELSNKHQQERDGLLAGINQRCAACQSDQHSFPWLSMLCIKPDPCLRSHLLAQVSLHKTLSKGFISEKAMSVSQVSYMMMPASTNANQATRKFQKPQSHTISGRNAFAGR